jgi:hypothetical protein
MLDAGTLRFRRQMDGDAEGVDQVDGAVAPDPRVLHSSCDAHPASLATRLGMRGIRGSVVGFGITAGSPVASTSLTAHFGAVADASRVARGSVSAQHAKCDTDAAATQTTLDALRAQLATRTKAIYAHNLAVSSYNGQLQGFESSLAAFQAVLIAYLQDLVGRTFTTTALNDAANTLDDERTVLVARREALTSLCNALQDEAAQLTSQV